MCIYGDHVSPLQLIPKEGKKKLPSELCLVFSLLPLKAKGIREMEEGGWLEMVGGGLLHIIACLPCVYLIEVFIRRI